jgi:hypothetical protein
VKCSASVRSASVRSASGCSDSGGRSCRCC